MFLVIILIDFFIFPSRFLFQIGSSWSIILRCLWNARRSRLATWRWVWNSDYLEKFGGKIEKCRKMQKNWKFLAEKFNFVLLKFSKIQIFNSFFKNLYKTFFRNALMSSPNFSTRVTSPTSQLTLPTLNSSFVSWILLSLSSKAAVMKTWRS